MIMHTAVIGIRPFLGINAPGIAGCLWLISRVPISLSLIVSARVFIAFQTSLLLLPLLLSCFSRVRLCATP